MRFEQVYINQSAPSSLLWRGVFGLGVFFVLAGFTILVFPEILVALVSGLVMMVGVGLIGAGIRMRLAGPMVQSGGDPGGPVVEVERVKRL